MNRSERAEEAEPNQFSVLFENICDDFPLRTPWKPHKNHRNRMEFSAACLLLLSEYWSTRMDTHELRKSFIALAGSNRPVASIWFIVPFLLAVYFTYTFCIVHFCVLLHSLSYSTPEYPKWLSHFQPAHWAKKITNEKVSIEIMRFISDLIKWTIS